jgi:hypothetical protein
MLGNVMDIVMTRGAERTTTTRICRDDGLTLRLPSQIPRRRLPHDLAHFVVERALGLSRGFWGSIAAGAILEGTEVLPRRHARGARERSREVMQRTGSQMTEAEALVGTLMRIYEHGLDRDWPEARKLLAAMWRPARPTRPLPDQGEVQHACDALADAERRWLAMAVGETLALRWPRTRRSSGLRGGLAL